MPKNRFTPKRSSRMSTRTAPSAIATRPALNLAGAVDLVAAFWVVARVGCAAALVGFRRTTCVSTLAFAAGAGFSVFSETCDCSAASGAADSIAGAIASNTTAARTAGVRPRTPRFTKLLPSPRQRFR
jgi:hypothetical protein